MQNKWKKIDLRLDRDNLPCPYGFSTWGLIRKDDCSNEMILNSNDQWLPHTGMCENEILCEPINVYFLAAIREQ